MATFSRKILIDDDAAQEVLVKANAWLEIVEEDLKREESFGHITHFRLAELKTRRDMLLRLFDSELCSKYREVE